MFIFILWRCRSQAIRVLMQCSFCYKRLVWHVTFVIESDRYLPSLLLLQVLLWLHNYYTFYGYMEISLLWSAGVYKYVTESWNNGLAEFHPCSAFRQLSRVFEASWHFVVKVDVDKMRNIFSVALILAFGKECSLHEYFFSNYNIMMI